MQAAEWFCVFRCVGKLILGLGIIPLSALLTASTCGGDSVSSPRFYAMASSASLTSILLMVLIIFPAALHAQVAGGTLSGTITDPTGRAVPQAQILIKNVATCVERTVSTNTDGFYTSVNLLPGEDQIRVTATGFNTEGKTGITMNVDAQQTFDVTLKVGTVANTVRLTTEAPAVQLTSSEISATVKSTTVRELPLNGRSWTDLAALHPGVDTIQTQPSFATRYDRGRRRFLDH